MILMYPDNKITIIRKQENSSFHGLKVPNKKYVKKNNPMSNVDIVLYVLLHGKLFLNKNLFQLLSSMFAPQACFKCATLHTQTKQIPFSYLFFSQCIAFFQTIYLRTKLMTSKMLCTEKKII